MIVKTVELKNEYPVQGGTLECIALEKVFDEENINKDWKRPAMIVVPGGGYWNVSSREALPIATAYLDRGFQVFVLNYLTRQDNVKYPEQLLEIASAVDFVKKHAEEFSVNPEEVFAVGFSAGGHLVANLATCYMNVSAMAKQDLDCKPTAVVLGYPVISVKEKHVGSYENLLYGYDEEEKAKLLTTLNMDENVTEETVPCFIWTTAKDNIVPCTNSLVFALALARHNVPYELHIYPTGKHGLSACNKEVSKYYEDDYTRTKNWMNDSAEFLRTFTKEQF